MEKLRPGYYVRAYLAVPLDDAEPLPRIEDAMNELQQNELLQSENLYEIVRVDERGNERTVCFGSRNWY